MRNSIIYIYLFAALLGLAPLHPAVAGSKVAGTPASVGKSVCGMNVANVAVKRNAGLVTLGMTLDLGSFELPGNRVSVFSPVIVNGADSLTLPPVGLYSRTRWFQYLRSGDSPLGGDTETSIRWSERPESLGYEQTFPYEEWMDGSMLYLKRSDYGCCQSLVNECMSPLTEYRELRYRPVFRYVRPVAEEVKSRELVGKAFIDFPVNRTELYPDYRQNPRELSKIIATIDSIRNDRDVTVRKITIKGYASPESPWDNNTRLAKGRTATLKRYVTNLYHFDDDFIATDYEPEDWAGLRAFVETSGLEHKAEILAIIDDTSLAPDPKELRLKTSYPDEYRFLLQTVYPGLRHSDYTIEYTIRQFSDIDEIRAMMSSAPQKLSLNEMYRLAETYEAGSREYNEVFETAVRMYPNDEIANLNAANSAMSRNDFASAEKYLEKVGNTDEATYVKGVLAALQGNYVIATKMFTAIKDRMPDAEKALDTITEIMGNSNK